MNIDLNKLEGIWKLNVNAHGRTRHGWARSYSPTIAGQECVGIAAIHYADTWPSTGVDTSAILGVWADGKTTLNSGATLGTVTVSLPRWVNITPVTIFAYDTNVTPGWYEKNVAIINSDAANYIFDPTEPDWTNYLYSYTMTTPLPLTNGGEASGDIPAGTYKYVMTEVSRFGQESLPSTALTVTSATDFKVTLTRPAMQNATTVFWRIYRSLRSDTDGDEMYSWVADIESNALVTSSIVVGGLVDDEVAKTDLAAGLNNVAAHVTVGGATLPGVVEYVAVMPGVAGNAISVWHKTGSSESCVISGKAIVVTLNSGVSTAASVKATLDTAVAAVVSTYQDNKLVQNLGLPVDIMRIVTPATCKFSTMHLNSLVSSGNSKESTTLYFEDVSLATSGFTRSGYPEIGCTKMTWQIPESAAIVALQSYKNMLFAFTKSSIWALHEKPWSDEAMWRKVTDQVGTSSFRTVVQYNGMLYFMDTDKANLWVTDGYELSKLNSEHIMNEVFYHLSGLQDGTNRHKLQGGWTAELVFTDPMHDEIYFGGELCTDAYINTPDIISGVWSPAAGAANPQLNRQYFWWVYHVSTKKLVPYTNIPAKCACNLDGTVYFGDELQYINSLKRDEPTDGLSTKGCMIPTLTAGTGTTIAWSGSWSGTHVPNAPVTIYRTDGTTQLVYSRAGGGVDTLIVEKSITVTADDRLAYGTVVTDTWVPIANDSAYVAELEWIVEPFAVRGYCNMLGLWRGNQSAVTWTKVIDWIPMNAAYAKAYIGLQGIAPLIRFILPAITGDVTGSGAIHETPFNGYIALLKGNAQLMDGSRW